MNNSVLPKYRGTWRLILFDNELIDFCKFNFLNKKITWKKIIFDRIRPIRNTECILELNSGIGPDFEDAAALWAVPAPRRITDRRSDSFAPLCSAWRFAIFPIDNAKWIRRRCPTVWWSGSRWICRSGCCCCCASFWHCRTLPKVDWLK